MSIYKTDHEILRKEEELTLIIKSQAGDQLALQRLIECNIKLVYSFARKGGYLWSYPDKEDDIIQVGMLGLLHAIKKFDAERGMRLSTYSGNWIIQYISRSFKQGEHDSAISYPVHHARIVSILRHIDREHEITESNVFGLYVLECIGRGINSTTHTEAQVINSFTFMKSGQFSGDAIMDIGSDVDEKRCFFDTVECHEPNPERTLMNEDMSRLIHRMFGEVNLSDRDKNVLRLRFGVGIYDELTLEEIGVQYDIVRERVRQIQNTGLMKCETWLHWNGYNEISDVL
jgi:RNA polymerase primary sigma factor